jgi:hypothetical protein
MVSSQDRVRNPDRYSPDPVELHVSPGLAAMEPPFDQHFHQTRYRGGGRGNRPSLVRQVFRALIYSMLIVAIAGLPLAWQFGDKNTKEMIRAWAIPMEKWALAFGAKTSPVAAEMSSSAPNVAKMVPKIADGAPTPDTSALQAARNAQLMPTAAPASPPAGPSAELQRQLEAISSELAIVRRMVEQLGARQGQMAEELAALQSAEHDISQKLPPAPQAAHPQSHKNVPKPMPLEAPLQSSSTPLPAARPPQPSPQQ